MFSNVKHLYLRAAFGLSPKDYEDISNEKTAKAVDHLFDQARVVAEKALEEEIYEPGDERPSKEDRMERKKIEKKLVVLQNISWVSRMADPAESPFLEKMCLFWHDHFACRTRGSKIAQVQLNTIRQHALGNFRAFVKAMARDVSMIRFLNNQQNRKKQPNENFARELMELFTLGRGNYTEKDIKEAARAFTGWSSDFSGDFVFRQFQHDDGNKVFMGKKGRFDGDDIIDIILEKKESARFIAQKAYRFFVNPQDNTEHINFLADRFYESDYDIQVLMRSIFESNWFYDSRNKGVLVKSPVELLAGIMKTLTLSFDQPLAILFVQKALGQVLFNPPNVAGWPSGHGWIDNSTLMLRLNLASNLINASEFDVRFKEEAEVAPIKKFRKIQAEIDLNSIEKLLPGGSAKEDIKKLADVLLPDGTTPNLEVVERFVQYADFGTPLSRMISGIMSLPEYQLL